jgi:hypothetical protein
LNEYNELKGTIKREQIQIPMPVYITYFIQILLVIHVMKTGKNRYWIYLLLFLPFVGGVAYFVIEILPEFRTSIQGQRAMRGVRDAVNPGAELQTHQAAWDQSPNADNARRYAQALLNQGQYSQANEVLDQALSGFFSTEPSLLLLKAKSKFDSGDHEESMRVLELLQEANPEFRSAEGHLLYAQALEASGNTEKALQEYREVSLYFPGVEARYCLCLALEAAGNKSEAINEFELLLKDAEVAPAHFQKSQKKWLTLARTKIKQLQD